MCARTRLVVHLTRSFFLLISVSLQMMTLIVYGTKHDDFFTKLQPERPSDSFHVRRQTPALSWAYFLAAASTLLATVSGVLLLLEFKHLTYKEIFRDSDQELCPTENI